MLGGINNFNDVYFPSQGWTVLFHIAISKKNQVLDND